MQNKKYTVSFGQGVTVIPSKAAERIISGDAGELETRVLIALLSIPSESERTGEAVASAAGVSEAELTASIAYWRGAGIIKSAAASLKESGEGKERDPSSSEATADDRKDTEKSESESAQSKEPAEKKKKLLSNESRKYTGEQISSLLDKDGGQLKKMVDVCQQLIGHILNPNEINTLVGLCDWLGLDVEYVITLCSYYTEKKPGCNVRYIERVAVELVNEGLDTPQLLDEHIKQMEIYDGIAGKIRSWLGIGGREYTKKENTHIKHWISDLCYGEDIIKYAYEITVNAKQTFSFDYAGRILDNWYAAGVRSLDQAKKSVEDFKAQKTGADKGSFETDEFFKLAMKRSYGKLKKDDKQ